MINFESFIILPNINLLFAQLPLKIFVLVCSDFNNSFWQKDNEILWALASIFHSFPIKIILLSSLLKIVYVKKKNYYTEATKKLNLNLKFNNYLLHFHCFGDSSWLISFFKSLFESFSQSEDSIVLFFTGAG